MIGSKIDTIKAVIPTHLCTCFRLWSLDNVIHIHLVLPHEIQWQIKRIIVGVIPEGPRAKKIEQAFRRFQARPIQPGDLMMLPGAAKESGHTDGLTHMACCMVNFVIMDLQAL